MPNDKYTRAILKGEELHENNLREFLYKNELLSSIDSRLEISQFSGGYSNLTYLLETDIQDYVLRMPPKGATKRGHDMSREFKILSHLKNGFDQCPKAFVFEKNEEILGANFYIMEKAEGIILNAKEAIHRHIPSENFKTISSTWLDTFVSLHQVDYDAVGLSDLGKPEGYVARQVSNWSKQYIKAATRDIPTMFTMMDWLDKHQPTQYKHCLIHNDFKYDNVVFKNDDWKEITAVLDWEMCTLGDPLMDLGTSLAYWTTSEDPEMLQMGLKSPTSLQGNPNRMEIVEMYAQRTGTNVDNLVFYYVFGLFKISVIAQQIFYRYQNGLTKDPKFAQLAMVAEMLSNLGLIAINKKRIDNLI